MRTIKLTALAIFLMAPLAANAQQGQQSTDDQIEFKQGVKAEHPTLKRQEIIRSEENNNTGPGDRMDRTNGAGEGLNRPEVQRERQR